jgi:hypothetical protein
MSTTHGVWIVMPADSMIDPRLRGWLILLLIASVPEMAPATVDGRVSFGWRWLSDASSLGTDAQAATTRLRLRSHELGARRLQLRFGIDDYRALDARHAQSEAGALYTAYDNRLRLRRAGVDVDVAGGRLQLGRHRPQMRVIGAGDTDGASWSGSHGALRAAVAGGRRVAFWKQNTGAASGPAHWGGELSWSATPATQLAMGSWRDEAIDGTRRWRVGANGRFVIPGGIELTAHAETEPGKDRVLWRLHSGWRAGGWRLRADAGGQRLPLFPVAGRADSSHYGGSSRSLGLMVAHRWGRNVDVSLRLRSRFGARRQRSEIVGLRWSRLWHGTSLRLQLTDSWSRWRQLERADLVLTNRLGQRWHVSAGANATAFQWRDSRAPKWRTRFRPHLGLRCRLGGREVQLRVEEQVDEFTHLRTQVYAGISSQL